MNPQETTEHWIAEVENVAKDAVAQILRLKEGRIASLRAYDQLNRYVRELQEENSVLREKLVVKEKKPAMTPKQAQEQHTHDGYTALGLKRVEVKDVAVANED